MKLFLALLLRGIVTFAAADTESYTVALSRSPITAASESTVDSIVAVTGSSISLSCAAHSQVILAWDYYPHKSGPTQRITIYSGGTPSYDLDPRFVLTGCINNCSLVILDLQLKDAGHFVCVPLHSVARNMSITVLESPRCRTNISLPGNAIDESDQLEITCRVRHNGSWSPTFSCASGFPGHADSIETSLSAVTYRRVIPASDVADFAVLHCTMTFSLATEEHNNAVVPHFEFIWNTSTIRVVNSVEWLAAYKAVTMTTASRLTRTFQWSQSSVSDNEQADWTTQRYILSTTLQTSRGIQLTSWLTSIIVAIIILSVAVIFVIALVCYYQRRMKAMTESLTPKSTRPTAENRALPQLPATASNSRLNLPASDVAPSAAVQDDGHSIIAGRSGAGTRTRTDRENDDRHAAMDSISSGRDTEDGRTSYWPVDDLYHYIDIDWQNTQPGSVDQSVSSRGYEGLDPAVLPALGQPQRPRREYAGLVSAVERPRATDSAAQHSDIDMNDVSAAGNNSHMHATQQDRIRGYEGLELESLRAAPRPREYAGLAGLDHTTPRIQGPVAGSHSPTDGFDQHGYLQVVADPDNGDQTETRAEYSGSSSGAGGYEALDASDVEQARLRAQQPVLYVGLHADN